MPLALERPAPSAGPSLPQLDALRGVAILAVFVQHLGDRFLPLVRASVEARAPAPLVPWILTVLHHAWWGVDLFFVLSGFSLGLSWIRSGGQPPRDFLLRRAARILPAYWVALVVTIAFHRGVFGAPSFAASLAAHLLVLQGYVSPGGIVIIGATWSLTTEACFYLVFPWLAPLVCKEGRRAIWIGAGVVIGSWLVRMWLHAIVLEPGIHTGLLEATQRRWIPSRLDQFVLGALAARVYVALARSERAAALAPYALAACVPALVIAFRLEGLHYLEPGGGAPYALLSLVTAALVLSAVLCRGRALGIVAPRPLAFVGIVSYGVFLYHQLALGLSDLEPASPPTWKNLVRTASFALVASVVVGYASWVLVERPAMRWASQKRRESRPSPA
ncbi:acyltransferase family protein [Polyangium mundeleinium]|uniref:Acyltransferase n=1 Tax=Polyangium mundeleinium TaxID=2995306 RepID=A0ABT5F431_9BACT|nr:acyltransferase [Polyangium mundeleinium]MDC0748843.1 acyltransferase [Polyangium mundeleinium]